MQERQILFLVSVTILFLAMFSAGIDWRGFIDIEIVPTAKCSWTPSYNTTWIAIDGIVSGYGSDPAYGWLCLYGEEEEWAGGMCILLVNPLAPEIDYWSLPQNFTIYATGIYNTSVVKLNYNECDLFVSGFWIVGNATEDGYYLDVFGPLHDDTTLFAGELAVTGNWTSFTINIENLEPIQGDITNYFAEEITVTWRGLPIGDMDCNGFFDVKDLLTIAMHYGRYFGHREYLLKADINFDLFIDIKDILEVALKFGLGY